MAEFSKGIRKFWMNAARHRFGEVNGMAPEVLLVVRNEAIELSGRSADEVHHAIPGSLAEARGQLPNEQVGIPVSRGGHRGKRAMPYQEEYSFHPDMAEAAERYRRGHKKAFVEARARHRAEVNAGKEPYGFDPVIARVLEEEMEIAAFQFVTETGVRKPISSKQRPRMGHWTDIPLGLRPDPDGSKP